MSPHHTARTFLSSILTLLLVGCGVSATAQEPLGINSAYPGPGETATIALSPTPSPSSTPSLNPLGQTAVAMDTAIAERAEVARQTDIALGPITPEPTPTFGPTAVPSNAQPLADGWLFTEVASSDSDTIWKHLWRRESAERILIVRVGGQQPQEVNRDGVMQGVVELSYRLPPLEPGWPSRPDPASAGGRFVVPVRDGSASIVDGLVTGQSTLLVIATEGGSTYVLDTAAETFTPAAPPTLTVGGPYTVAEGSSIEIEVSGEDPIASRLTYAWDMDNDGSFEVLGSRTSFDAVLLDGPRTERVQARVTSSSGLSSIAEVEVQVENEPPTGTFSLSDIAIQEGDRIRLTLSDSYDPGAEDRMAGFAYTFDCGQEGVPNIINSPSPEFDCRYLDDGTITTQATIQDNDGGQSVYTQTLQIANVAPSIDSLHAASEALRVNQVLTVSATFADPGLRDTHTGDWDWGDGTTSLGTITTASGSGTITDQHTFTTPGLYPIHLSVTDDDGGVAEAGLEYVAVYDTKGTVSVGGYFTSPAGAYLQQPDSAGRTVLTVNTKYLPRADTPSGNVSLQFQPGQLRFQGTSFHWMVVERQKVVIRGIGQVNGADGYEFVLVLDDSSSVGKNRGTVRLRVWERQSGTVVYDTQPATPITTPPTIPLQGGSIVIKPQ
jgi:hypothetical protein